MKSVRFAPAAVCVLVLVNVSVVASVDAAKPIWAKGAVRVEPGCVDEGRVPTQRIPAPDRNVRVEIECRGSTPDDTAVILRVVFADERSRTLLLEKPGYDLWRPEELLWSSDSRAFLVNGGESAYAGFTLVAYELRDNDVVAHDVTAAAERDMVARFPPCKAANADEQDCKRMEKDPQFNMSALAWINGSSTIVVFAEVPPSSSYGGIMGQVQGYELDARPVRF